MTYMTYIIKCHNGEYYCGESNNIIKTVDKHRAEKHPGYFSVPSRKPFSVVFLSPGRLSKKIKAFGIKKYYESTQYNNEIFNKIIDL